MDSGIQFGKLEREGPRPRTRPDRDRQFAVVGCGVRDEADLPIFVDLDVMREMEGHARTNTHVELGGVLLGGKFIDEAGEPFVVVSESLRAEHYEATRGSFKFTHETWARITRDREDFPAELQLVGWYHTHPDWGVFLSGMDLFICDHFFSDELDVALVIDPCRGDRGWFHWSGQSAARAKRRVEGYYLFANRYRRGELLHFARELAEVNPAYYDPRYEASLGESDMQPVVHLHQPQSGGQTIALMGMLTIQTLVLALLAWRVLYPPPSPEPAFAQQARNEVYREILGGMAANPDGPVQIVERVEQLAKTNQELRTSVEGQSMLILGLKRDQEDRISRQAGLEEKLDLANQEIDEKKASIRGLQGELSNYQEGKTASWLSWPIAGGLALFTAVVGILAGWLWGRSREWDYELPDAPKPEPDREFSDQHEINEE